MNSIRIKNMRTLVDTGDIELKPVNVLVGNNSSGKSTFLRVFPLLKQSFSKRINGPILWAGDRDDYVDFSSFSETLYKNSKENCIVLEFSISYTYLEILNRFSKYRFFDYNDSKYNKKSLAKLVIEISRKSKLDDVSKIKIICDNSEIEINRENNKEYYNGTEISPNKSKINDNLEVKYRSVIDNQNTILNIIYSVFSYKNIYESLLNSMFNNDDENINSLRGIDEIFKEDFILKLMIENHFNNDLEMNEFVDNYKKEVLKENSKRFKDIINSFSKIINKQALNENIKKDLDILFISNVAKHCIDYIRQYFLNVNYIKPVRAHAERYYRLLNLSVYQIDSDGTNLPIFINSLSDSNLEKFNEWIFEYFKFTVIPNQTDGHVSIYIKKDNKEINLSDTGYGYSQLLPIITQLWVILNMQLKELKNTPIIFAIEQPELHLHPSLQAKLIDVITKIAQRHKNKIQFILETHSETMINRLGNLVYKHKISEKDINVIIFDREIGEDNTKIRISSFDKEGYLQNWPIGFFGVDDIE